MFIVVVCASFCARYIHKSSIRALGAGVDLAVMAAAAFTRLSVPSADR